MTRLSTPRPVRATLLFTALLVTIADGVTSPASAQSPKTTTAVTAADLMQRVQILAHDSMLGREAGTIGNVRATNYVARELQRMGLTAA
ncbi:MAG TPA: hypothetical protein VF035_09880, partial [Longimicrobiales bacterium]